MVDPQLTSSAAEKPSEGAVSGSHWETAPPISTALSRKRTEYGTAQYWEGNGSSDYWEGNGSRVAVGDGASLEAA